MEKRDERILRILQSDDTRRTNENLEKYLEFLNKKISYPCLLTGGEDFKWEEFYVLGLGSREEYEELKKTRPSYTDTFELLGLLDKVDLILGLFARVKRTSDKQIFLIPLVDLEATEKKSPNFQLLQDFSIWFVNS